MFEQQVASALQGMGIVPGEKRVVHCCTSETCYPFTEHEQLNIHLTDWCIDGSDDDGEIQYPAHQTPTYRLLTTNREELTEYLKYCNWEKFWDWGRENHNNEYSKDREQALRLLDVRERPKPDCTQYELVGLILIHGAWWDDMYDGAPDLWSLIQPA